MLATANPEAALRDLNHRVSGRVAALLSRDGRLFAVDSPESVFSEVSSVMCATAFGAAVAMHSELGRSPPHTLVIEAPGTWTIIAVAGNSALLASVVDQKTDLPSAVREVTKFATLLGVRAV